MRARTGVEEPRGRAFGVQTTLQRAQPGKVRSKTHNFALVVFDIAVAVDIKRE